MIIYSFIKIIRNIFLVILIHFFLKAQDTGEIKFDLKSLNFQLNNLSTSWKPELKNKDFHSLLIKDYKISFSNIDINNIYNKEQSTTEITINGPDLVIKDFKINSKVNSKNWITEEKIKRLNNRQSIPKECLEKIAKASELYFIDSDTLPQSLNDLSIRNYINLDKAPLNDYSWTYELNLPENIIAFPTNENLRAHDNSILYNWNTKDFQLNPILDSLYQVPNIEWNYEFKVQEIVQSFSSTAKIIFDPQSKKIDFKLNKSKFLIENLIFLATPEFQLENQIKISLPELMLEIKNLLIEGSIKETILMHSIDSDFRIRNFDIKIPKDLIKEPEIEKLLKTLGIWNNSLRVRLIDVNLQLINEHTGTSLIKIHTPFIKVLIDAKFTIRQNGTFPTRITFHNSEIKINPISLGVRKYIRTWEKNNKKSLKREGSTIILKANGPIDNILIQGF